MARSSEIGAAELLRRLDAGQISAQEYAQEIVRSCRELAELNAVSFFDPDLLAEFARGADEKRSKGEGGRLCGLPLIVKDNINTTAYPTTGGTGALQNCTPETNAGVISRLLGEDAIIGAKSGMHELAFGITSNNAVTGAVRNPHDTSKIPGGSSGGTAAAVAAGMFPAGLGTDTGGSCRIPAALCGVVGFRPTHGRYAGDGIVPISHTRDTAGPLARCVEDISLLDGVLSGEEVKTAQVNPADMRLGVPAEVFFDNLEPEVEAGVQESLRALEKAGATLVDVSFADIWSHNEAFSFPVVFYEVMRDLPAYLQKHAPHVTLGSLVEQIGSPDVAGAIGSQLGEDAMPQEAYRAAMDVHRPAMRKIYEDVFRTSGLAAIVFPTTPLRARDIGLDETVELNGAQVPTFPTYIRNTDLGSNLGVPGISLPCRSVAGLPVGIEFDGMAGADAGLLSLARAAEAVLSQ
ncbi:indoleacetamide hydrolase [Hoeflea prorocentri]|uniref:Indoleacetamide hydrolase n=1 Tax=Hoeflea prorocentri TaxID=1922333 RepID=A0A9X3ZJY8_9HYPH|nr:indoleacetamide hydrolase [Hoeflea prorocentri]MCY6383593.1 indoleacetamide hydrolase [Hoeflea prorocentri]MDA5401393.1 indoleacetamide hydrolase [Hoeflea prorocentri]